MEVKISERLNTILGYAREEAIRTGSYAISVDHLTLGILRDAENAACRALESLGIDTSEMKGYIDSRILSPNRIPFSEDIRISVSRGAENALNMAALEALKTGTPEVEACHLLAAISRLSGNVGQDYFTETGVSPESLREAILKSCRPDDAGDSPISEPAAAGATVKGTAVKMPPICITVAKNKICS